MRDYLFRTAITGINPSEYQVRALNDTVGEWLNACQIVVDYGWEQGVYTRAKLQPAVYEDVRENTALKSQHAILAIRQASDALVSVDERRQRGRSVSKPQFTNPTITYDSRTMSIFDDDTISLTTTSERIRFPLILPQRNEGYQWQYLQSDKWQLAESNLTRKGGEFLMHLRFRKLALNNREVNCEDTTILGVDLGIENIAVTSTAYFASGQELVHRHQEFEKIRGSLQGTGTQSAHRTIQKRAGREERYTRDVLHQISQDIVLEARRYGCNVIAIENLKNIRDRAGSKKFHQWAHRQLTNYIRYKAREAGIEMEFVAPRNTSRRCSDCGYTSQKNRPNRGTFRCKQCGKTSNADYNAAKNIGWRLVRCEQQSSHRTGHCQLALKSGTVTPNGEFIPYPSEGTEVENTDKLRRSTKQSNGNPRSS